MIFTTWLKLVSTYSWRELLLVCWSRLIAGLLEPANWSILALHRLLKEVVGEKNQDFMLIRLFNANDIIGCGGGH